MTSVHLLLFGDQNVEKLSSIKSLVHHSKTSSAAKTFLQQATDLVQLEFSPLSQYDQSWDHGIDTLLGIVEENAADEQTNFILETVLMCVGRLGELIVYAEEDPDILGSLTEPVHVLAFCSGLLPAAAAITARDTSELIKIGLEIVSVTFRMSFEISRCMKLVEDSEQKWGVTVSRISQETASRILQDFHGSQGLPYYRRITVGVAAKDWLTLIGPPSSLKRLFEWSSELQKALKVPTDINGPIHTTHVPPINKDLVLGGSTLLDMPLQRKMRMVSNSSKKLYEHQTLRELLREIIQDIAHETLLFTETLEHCISGLTGQPKVKLTMVGPTRHLATVQKALSDNKIECEVNSVNAQDGNQRRGGSDLVAIVGMAGRFPGSETIDGFWEDLMAGKNNITKIPKTRFDLDMFYDRTGKRTNSTTAQYGAWLNEPGLFDNRLFNISPREAAQMDPIQRLLLTVSYEALEMSGYYPNGSLATQSDRIATYFGQTADDWREILNNEGIDIYYIPSVIKAFGPSRLNYFYKWGGASYAIDSACATSTTAVSLACSALLARECDTALAGGGSVLVSPTYFSGLSKSGMISTTGGCRTFHDDADGYARGEGVGVVVLRRLEDALRDNDNVLAVVRGSARTYSSTSSSITHPDARAQQKLYEKVMRQTALDAHDISYVEMHGTGTQAGDAEEVTSVLRVLAQNRASDNPLTVGAVKANVGHGEAAAGITSLIKTLMILKEGNIPPQPDQPFKMNRNFPSLQMHNVRIARKGMTLQPRPGGDGVKRILLNSFDASGGNTSMVIEEGPKIGAKLSDPRAYHVVTISAKTTNSLFRNQERLLDYLMRHSEVDLADVAYTTTSRRMHQDLRIAYVVKSCTELQQSIRASVDKKLVSKQSTFKRSQKSLVFTFTGQGTQYSGFGKTIYEQSRSFRDILQTYQEMALLQGLPPFLELIYNSELDIQSQPMTRVHLAIVAFEIAMARILESWGCRPTCVIGHSLGEYAALCVADVLSVSDTLYLVGQRALLLQEMLVPGEFLMLAVRTDLVRLKTRLDVNKFPSCEIACMNAPSTFVVSGIREEIYRLKKTLEGDGIKTTKLNIMYGFHCKQVELILPAFRTIADGVIYSTPRIPVASTLLGRVVSTDGVFSSTYLARQTREAVDFVGALNSYDVGAEKGTFWLEIGPDPICIGLVRESLAVETDDLLASTKSTENNWKSVSSTLAAFYRGGFAIHWPEFHKDFKQCVKLLNLPTYAFDGKQYWKTYVEPQRTRSLDDKTLANGRARDHLTNKHLTASLQYIKEEIEDTNQFCVTFVCHTSEPHLYAAIHGHAVNGTVVCPFSVFTDMALTAASYISSKAGPKIAPPEMSIRDIELTHPLCVPEIDSTQLVYITAARTAGDNFVSVKFSSSRGGNMQDHGSCVVSFGNPDSWRNNFSRTLFLIRERIDSLKSMATNGQAHHLLSSVVYKLFTNVVTYGSDYQALQEVYLDNNMKDAVGIVRLSKDVEAYPFAHNPYWSDSVIHLAGFLVNCGLKYSSDFGCISTSFESSHTFQKLSADKTYTSYVCMEELTDSPVVIGDCYVFDRDTLVTVTTGIKFTRVTKVVLNAILSPAGPLPKKSMHGQTPDFKGPVITEPRRFQECQTSPDVVNVTLPHSSSPNATSVISDTTVVSSMEKVSTSHAERLLDLLALQSGFHRDDMNDDTVFTDMGIDSLMGITITASFQQETGLELPGTFFIENRNVRQAKAALCPYGESHTRAPIQHQPVTEIVGQQDFPYIDRNGNHQADIRAGPESPDIEDSRSSISSLLSQYSSRAVRLQGAASETRKYLFLLPEVSGSSVIYTQIPALSSDTCIYGLESPFLKNPSQFDLGVPEVAKIFVQAIRSIQPKGPYMIGGFSFGAIYAYEVAKELLEAGDEVARLLIVDMCVPKGNTAIDSGYAMEQLEATSFIEKVGRKSQLQKEHLKRAVETLLRHDLQPPNLGLLPINTILIQSESTWKNVSQIDWLCSHDMARGWDKLVRDVTLRTLDMDHLAFLRHPGVKSLANIMKDVLG